MEQGLGSSTWWEEAEYEQLGTANLRALFILDKLFKRDTAKFPDCVGGCLSWTPPVRAQPDSAR